MNLSAYKLSEEEQKKLDDYELILEGVKLSLIGKDILDGLRNKSGVYFWVMNFEQEKYKIYIGKSGSLGRRLEDYKKEFQIHSPNDFKMRFFQEFANTHFEGSSLDLFFKENEDEKFAIQSFSPIAINEKPKTTDDMKAKMKQAFKEYYQETFCSKFKNIQSSYPE